MKTSMRATKGQAPLIITVFGLVGMVSLAFIASFAFLSGVAWHVMLVIVFGFLPPLIQVTIAILYLNGHPDTELDFS
jgi:fatty acid desaturase